MSDQIACTENACGAINRAGDSHCVSCGRELPVAPHEGRAGGWDFDLKDVRAWLVSPPLAPVPLGPRPKIVIGRAAECDLVLRHGSVSRHHCTVTCRGDSFSVHDEGSSNGTYLNGKRISQSPLNEGDVLSLGRFEVEVRSNESMQGEADLDMEGTHVLEASQITTHMLQDTSLAETLQAMEFNRRSGTLRVLSGQLRGVLVINQGRPLWAKLGVQEGLEAVLGMLGLKEGRLTISGELEPGETTMHTTITGLLLEASRREDEAQGFDRDQTVQIPRLELGPEDEETSGGGREVSEHGDDSEAAEAVEAPEAKAEG